MSQLGPNLTSVVMERWMITGRNGSPCALDQCEWSSQQQHKAKPYTPLLFPSTCVTSAVSPQSSCHLLRETNKIPYRTDFKELLDRSKDIITCSQWDGPGNKDTCHQVWRPELNPCNPHGGERNQILKLSSDLHIQAIACMWPPPHTHNVICGGKKRRMWTNPAHATANYKC